MIENVTGANLAILSRSLERNDDRQQQTDEREELNAFGIGRANAPEVELSPQARILQQTEQNQTARAEAFERLAERQRDDDNPNQDPAQENISPISTGTEYVRVSSSQGTAASNNLSSERATEIYRSIQELL